MPTLPHWTALVTLLAILLYFATIIRVGQARMRTGVKAPATTGDPHFERAFRIQMNTLEWLPVLLSALWLTAFYIGDAAAAAGGGVWIVGRILYIGGYSVAANKRGPGFAIQALAAIALWIAAFVGVANALVHLH